MGRNTTFGDEQFRGISDVSSFEPNMVFVIMPFSPVFNDVYSAIADECKKLRLKTVRVDQTIGSGIVLRKIFDLIERAEFLIVDLTDERPNIYYELGYAHGVGNEENDILLIAKDGTRLHFDVAPLSVQFYTSTEALRIIVSHHLKRMIKATR
jgi:hypothetical protein